MDLAQSTGILVVAGYPAALHVLHPEGWQYLSIPVFPYVGVAEYLGIDTAVLQYCSIASVGAKKSSETEEVPRI